MSCSNCHDCAFYLKRGDCPFDNPRFLDGMCLDFRLSGEFGSHRVPRNKIVAVSGGFDPIHIGHIKMIREASKLGDKLIVIVNSDRFLLTKKGYIFMPLEERKEIVDNVEGVDKVIVSIDEDQSVCKTLEMIRPDIFANGGDRKSDKDILEANTCRKIGCKMIFNVGGGKLQSSSQLVDASRRNDRSSR